MRRYPFDRLDTPGRSRHELCEAIGMSGSQANAYRGHGLPLEVAERCADRLGVHPYCLWPEMRDDVIASVVRVCAAEGCEETFEPLTVRRIYCSTRCRDRRAKADWARRRYRSDPVYREKRKADSAARYAAERDYVLAQRRRRTAV